MLKYPLSPIPDWWCCGSVPFSCQEMKTNGTVTLNIFSLITHSLLPVLLPALERFLFPTKKIHPFPRFSLSSQSVELVFAECRRVVLR